MPRTADVALLVNRKGTLAESQIEDAQAAVKTLGQSLHVINAGSDSEIDEAFRKMDQLNVGALLVGTDPLFAFLLRNPDCRACVSLQDFPPRTIRAHTSRPVG